MSRSDVRVLTKGNCYYCGASPSTLIRPGVYSSSIYTYNGIDRLDNEKGYELGNVVSCCGRCNRAKGTMHVDEFRKWIAAVHGHLFQARMKIALEESDGA